MRVTSIMGVPPPGCSIPLQLLQLIVATDLLRYMRPTKPVRGICTFDCIIVFPVDNNFLLEVLAYT